MNTAHPLTKAQLRELAAELRYERARVERALQSEGNGDAGIADTLAPLAADTAERGIGAAVESRTRLRFEALSEALRRIEDGTYGACVACGDGIPYGRLLAMPDATRCVACAERA